VGSVLVVVDEPASEVVGALGFAGPGTEGPAMTAADAGTRAA